MCNEIQNVFDADSDSGVYVPMQRLFSGWVPIFREDKKFMDARMSDIYRRAFALHSNCEGTNRAKQNWQCCAHTF